MLLLNGDQRKSHETDDTEGENDSIVVDTAMLETRCSESVCVCVYVWGMKINILKLGVVVINMYKLTNVAILSCLQFIGYWKRMQNYQY